MVRKAGEPYRKLLPPLLVSAARVPWNPQQKIWRSQQICWCWSWQNILLKHPWNQNTSTFNNICYIRKHNQFVELNSNIHAHNTRRKIDIHIQSYNTDLYKRSAINMDTKLYNKLPGTQNKQPAIRPSRRNWNHFFFCIPLLSGRICSSVTV